MHPEGSTKTTLSELIKYFGFAIISVMLVILSFLITRREISNEVQTATYQVLEEATRQQRITLQKYIDLLKARTKLIAEHNGNAGPITLVEVLRTELSGSVQHAEIGYANVFGKLTYSDQNITSVAGESWFRDSLFGETQVAMCSQNEENAQPDILVSAPVLTSGGTSGVLFVTVEGQEIANMLKTFVYDGAAVSLICNAGGDVLFCEPGETLFEPGDNLSQKIQPALLQKTSALSEFEEALQNQSAADVTFSIGESAYHAASEPVGVLDWSVVSIVPHEAANDIQQQVNEKLIGMLLIMLIAGVSMVLQAYYHERMTVRKLEQDKDLLRQSARRYQLITSLSNEVLFDINLNSGEITFNDSFETMFGFAPPDCKVDQLDRCADLFVEADKRRFLKLMNNLRAGAPEASEDLRMPNSRGIVRWKRIDVYSVFDQGGKVSQLVGKITDIHRQKQSMQRLIRQADSDPLTGLLNRGAMQRNVESYLAGEGHGGKHALFMLDFDNFKAVNDTLGHANGDNLLVSFAASVRRLFRSGDYSARIGGDEYMIFVKNIYDDSVALDKAEELRGEMARLSKKIGIPVSISVGVAVYNRDGATFETLYKAADEALYYVKNNGKNAVSFHTAAVGGENPEDKAAVAEPDEDRPNP